MIDFSNCKKFNKTFGGANGNKISIEYNNERYMLKFPSKANKNDDLSYANGCISEYIGCHIYNKLGIEAQETLLGEYNKNGKTKIVVACKDLTANDYVIQDFASLKNTVIGSSENGYGTDLNDVLNAIDTQELLDPAIIRERFWDMFICDSILGNFDRHNGNWGFLYNQKTDEIKLAPIFDCGSCLYPQADRNIMKAVLSDQAERNNRIYNYPASALKIDGKKISYYDYLQTTQKVDCLASLIKIHDKYEKVQDDIYDFIDSMECLEPLQVDFYTTMLEERFYRIIEPAYDRVRQLLDKDNTIENNIEFLDDKYNEIDFDIADE